MRRDVAARARAMVTAECVHDLAQRSRQARANRPFSSSSASMLSTNSRTYVDQLRRRARSRACTPRPRRLSRRIPGRRNSRASCTWINDRFRQGRAMLAKLTVLRPRRKPGSLPRKGFEFGQDGAARNAIE